MGISEKAKIAASSASSAVKIAHFFTAELQIIGFQTKKKKGRVDDSVLVFKKQKKGRLDDSALVFNKQNALLDCCLDTVCVCGNAIQTSCAKYP